MKPLLPISIGALAAGVIVVIIAAASWPRSYGFLTADPTGNIVGISIGSALISIGVLAGLLHLHAEAVGSNTESALMNHENKLREADRARVRAAERDSARQARLEQASEHSNARQTLLDQVAERVPGQAGNEQPAN